MNANGVKITSVEDMRTVLPTIFAGITFEASFVEFGLGRSHLVQNFLFKLLKIALTEVLKFFAL